MAIIKKLAACKSGYAVISSLQWTLTSQKTPRTDSRKEAREHLWMSCWYGFCGLRVVQRYGTMKLIPLLWQT